MANVFEKADLEQMRKRNAQHAKEKELNDFYNHIADTILLKFNNGSMKYKTSNPNEIYYNITPLTFYTNLEFDNTSYTYYILSKEILDILKPKFPNNISDVSCTIRKLAIDTSDDDDHWKIGICCSSSCIPTMIYKTGILVEVTVTRKLSTNDLKSIRK